MNNYQRNCLPEKSQWEAVLQSSVNLSFPKQDFLWVGVSILLFDKNVTK